VWNISLKAHRLRIRFPLNARPTLLQHTKQEFIMHFVKALLIAGVALLGVAAQAQTVTPVVTERQENQVTRIQQGVASGELSQQEAARLRTEQKGIRAEKRAFKADGKVTPAERAQLRRDQKAASRHIYKKKHNDKKAT
jgi:hypothetical protein